MPDWSFEEAARRTGAQRIAGIDEAGRGPWAGPVTAAACVLDPDRVDADLLGAIDDSKVLAPERRAAVAEGLRASPGVVYAVAHATVAEIDATALRRAPLLAMRRAVRGLAAAPDYLLVDGRDRLKTRTPCEAVIDGDARSLSIAAASIFAKVARDALMGKLARRHPGYGWERNMGYGTPEHQAALARLGVTPEHRRSWAPIRNMLGLWPAGTLHIESADSG